MTSPFLAVTLPRALKVTWALDSEALVFPMDRLFPETVMVFNCVSPVEAVWVPPTPNSSMVMSPALALPIFTVLEPDTPRDWI